MAVEQYIMGKCDNAKHDGLYANRKREQASQYELETGLQRYYEEVSETANNQAIGMGDRQQGQSIPPSSVDKRNTPDRTEHLHRGLQ